MLANRTPLEIAEHMFARTPETVDDAIEAWVNAYARLAQVMASVVGEAGYRAMFARSLQKARAAHSCLEGVVLADRVDFIEPLVARLRRQDLGAIRAATLTVTAQFVDLLSTLIGIELTLKLLQRAWPEAIATPLDLLRENS